MINKFTLLSYKHSITTFIGSECEPVEHYKLKVRVSYLFGLFVREKWIDFSIYPMVQDVIRFHKHWDSLIKSQAHIKI